MPGKKAVAALLPEELCRELELSPPFRGRQVFSWIARGATSFFQMTNLDKATRERLDGAAVLRSGSVTRTVTGGDGTMKLQVAFPDGCAVETVLLTDRDGRRTACVSSQAGCAMGCAFCRTGTLGLARNLSAAEIVEQFLFLEEKAGKLDNIVFMGMGEPLQNLGAVRKAVEVLTSPEGRALSARRITVSTCGLSEGIRELADLGPQVRLAVSLTAADQALRESLMPVARGNPLPELREAIAYYIRRTQRRVTLEAALMGGVNTGEESIRALVGFSRGLDVHVNLIPWNPVEGLPFRTPAQKECLEVQRGLEAAGIPCTLRLRRGASVDAACGQLGIAPGGDATLI